ncbi:MAG: DUF4332 domain-containing protein [Salinivirgaceae bacterium]|nr:DUF4332 domain-containing protein [Salinivirgaceae bacterium]
MAYYIDLSAISIDTYKIKLKNSTLIPSWKILLEEVDIYFDELKKMGINNLEQLFREIKNKDAIEQFSKRSGIPEKYLTVLRRAINAYRPKPNKISDFPDMSAEIISKLLEQGINTTLKLYDFVQTKNSRELLSKKAGVDLHEIEALAKLCDLSRIRWVNHTFAYVLYKSGFETVEKVANATPKNLYDRIKTLNEEMKIYKGTIGLNDMKICIEAAQEVPCEIDFFK